MKDLIKKQEEVIEELSMFVTHSEQGVYKKNEEEVRDIIVKFRKETAEFERGRILKALPDSYGWNNIVGSAPQENAEEVGFDICLKQITEIITNLNK